MLVKKIVGCLLALCCLQLAGCSSTKQVPPGDYDTSEIGKIKKVAPGVIISQRNVTLHNKALENSNTTTPPVSDADYNGNKTHGVEYIIRLNSGAIISVLQAENLNLSPRQHVLVIYGDNTRVMPDQGDDN